MIASEANPPSPVVVLGPAGMVAAAPAVPMTCSIRSPGPIAMPPARLVVHPVRLVALTPVQVITLVALGCLVWVRSTNSPATSCSGVPAAPVWLSEIVTAPAPGCSNTGAVVKASGSIPVDSVAGRPAKGLVAVGASWCTSMPTPLLSPAARSSV